MKYKNLIVIGTSHIAKESVEEVEKTIKAKNPDIISLELDKKRFYALVQKRKRKLTIADIRRIGVKGFIFNLVGAYIEAKLGQYVGVKPGSEMLAAIRLAKKNKKPIALIDRDIEITLKRFSQKFGFKDRFNLIKDIFSGIFKKQVLPFDIRKVPEKDVIKKLINQVKKKYPGAYSVLIEERNIIMGNNLYNIMKAHPKKLILAIIGAGHEEEIMNIIKENYLKAK